MNEGNGQKVMAATCTLVVERHRGNDTASSPADSAEEWNRSDKLAHLTPFSHASIGIETFCNVLSYGRSCPHHPDSLYIMY